MPDEAKQEKLLRYLHRRDWNNLSKEYRQAVLANGMQWSREAGAKMVPASQRLVQDGRIRSDLKAAAVFDVPPIVKRTPNQRLESMIEKLKDTPPAQLEGILRSIQGEYWKRGATVSIEELRLETAKAFLKRSDRRQ